MLLVDVNIYNGLVDLWIYYFGLYELYIKNLVTFETEILNIFGGKRTVGQL
jgi:hypothetical protein